MNVIQLVNDSHRRDHLGCYGNTWIHLLADDPRNLVHVPDQYYWAEDLA